MCLFPTETFDHYFAYLHEASFLVECHLTYFSLEEGPDTDRLAYILVLGCL